MSLPRDMEDSALPTTQDGFIKPEPGHHALPPVLTYQAFPSLAGTLGILPLALQPAPTSAKLALSIAGLHPSGLSLASSFAPRHTGFPGRGKTNWSATEAAFVTGLPGTPLFQDSSSLAEPAWPWASQSDTVWTCAFLRHGSFV